MSYARNLLSRGEEIVFESPLPADLSAFVERYAEAV